MAGADLRTIQELMGRETLAMTLRYAHLSPPHLHAAVRLLDTTTGGRTGTGSGAARGDEPPSPRNYESG